MAIEPRGADLVAAGGGGSAALLGAAALAGWAFALPRLTDLGTRGVPMAPSTALLFVLFGGVLVAASSSPPALSRTLRAAVAAGGAAAAALLVAALSGARPRIEHLGFSVPAASNGIPVGHISPLTALGFLLAAAGLAAALRIHGTRGWPARIASVAARLVAGGSAILLLAYLAGEPLFYGGSIIPPAAPTSAALLALGVGTLALVRSRAHEEKRGPRLGRSTELAFFWVFLGLAVGIALAGNAWLQTQNRQFRQEAADRLSAIADLKAGELERWRSERLRDGGALQENPTLVRLVRAIRDGSATPDETAELADWIESVRRSRHYEIAAVLAADATPLVVLPHGVSPPVPELRQRMQEALASRETLLLDLARARPSEPLRMGVLVPLLETSTRAGLGALYFSVDAGDFLQPFLARWPIRSASAETLLVRREGGDALFLTEPRFARGSALTLRIPLTRTEVPAVRAALGVVSVAEGVDYRGVRVLAATRVVAGSPWGLVARVDLDEVYAPLRGRLWLTVLLIGALLAAAGVGVEIAYRRRLADLDRERLQAQAERAWLRDVLERSLNELFVFDPASLHFLFVNRGAARHLGFSEEEILRLTPIDLELEHDEASFRNLLVSVAARRGEVHRFESRYRRKDGTEYPVEVHLQLVETGLGEFYLAVVNDISERRRAEERIRQLVRVYALLSNVNQAIVRIRDPLALCREACRIAVEDGGYRGAWMGLRANGDDRLSHIAGARASADGRPVAVESSEDLPYADLVAEALRTGKRAVAEPTMAGSAVPGEPVGAVAALPIASEGVGAGVLVLLADRRGAFDEDELHLLDEMAMDLAFALEMGRHEAERRAIETSLGRSERRFRTVARLSSDFSYSCIRAANGGFAVDWITDAFYSITGYSEAELRERRCWLFVAHPEDQATASEPLGRLFPGESDERELRILTRSGEQRWFLNRMECEADPAAPDGRRIFGAVQDVTLPRRAEEEVRRLNVELEDRVAERTRELAEANRELETFAYSVAHDLKAPLRAIDGYSQILLDEALDALDEEKRGFLLRLRAGAQRMAQLVEALLAYAHVDRRSLHREQIGLSGAIESVLVELQEEIRGCGATFDVELDGLSVYVDREGLAIVLRNLIGNALKYRKEGTAPHVRIRGVSDERYLRLSVVDNGIGFDMAYHDHLFEIFHRLHRTDEYSGTGIGLALVKKAVERMNGRVWAESHPGHGATFFVELPLRAGVERNRRRSTAFR